MLNKRIRNNRKSCFGQTTEIFSPTSTSRNEIQIPQYTDRETPRKKSDNMLQNMKIRFLLNTLAKKIRYLTPPLKTPENISQQWQTQAEQEQQLNLFNKHSKQTLKEQLSHKYQIFKYLNVIEGIIVVIFCWLVTISIVFQKKIGVQFFIVTLILTFGRIIFLSALALKEKINQHETFVIAIFDDLACPIMLMISCLLFIIRCTYQLGATAHLIEIFGFITVILQYNNIEQNFQNIVKFAQQNRMKKQLRIIELFLLIITLAHFFGLMMYAMHFMSPNINWLKTAKLDDQQWHIQYIYCFYWAITTTVTVGYGDLTPTNHYQVIIITIIQLIGTAIFGYMINVIGITVDEIKKKNEQFDNHQSTINKLSDHYHLSRQLCNKMKYDIKQKQKQEKSVPLKTTEQKQFLEYIQPNLKQQFVLQTNMKVIKKSLFFLTHFSVNFQNQIALKLIRIIYKPDEEIGIINKIEDERNLVIINSGSVDVFIENRHNNIQIVKKVREITPSEDSLAMNVFGYSSLIMNHDIKLKAVAKETAVSYVLRRKDLLECIQKSMLDFESFNQLRERMIMFGKMLEHVEAPTLCDKQWHYVPNIFLLQKKMKWIKQPRCSRANRRNSRLKLVTISKIQQPKTIHKMQEQPHMTVNGIKTFNQLLQQDFNSLKSILTNKHEQTMTFNEEEKPLIFNEYIRFDHYKNFQNFMKNSNLSNISIGYEKSCQYNSYKKRYLPDMIRVSGHYMSQCIFKQPLISYGNRSARR